MIFMCIQVQCFNIFAMRLCSAQGNSCVHVLMSVRVRLVFAVTEKSRTNLCFHGSYLCWQSVGPVLMIKFLLYHD